MAQASAERSLTFPRRRAAPLRVPPPPPPHVVRTAPAAAPSAESDELDSIDFDSLQLTPQHFEFGHLLGEGSYAMVVLARCSGLGMPIFDRKFACRLMDKALIAQARTREQLVLEHRIHRSLRHPNIVKLRATFQDTHTVYQLVDLAPCGNLHRLIRSYNLDKAPAGGVGSLHAGETSPRSPRPRLRAMSELSSPATLLPDDECAGVPFPVARFYAASIVRAMEHMHRHHVVHGDLKPENILLAESGDALVSDFGTAQFLDPASGALPTDAVSQLVGTTWYCAPEVLMATATSIGADIWALGCIVFELIAGRPLFRAKSDYEALGRIVSADVSFPAKFPTIGRDLVERLLKVDPAERLGTAGQAECTPASLSRGYSQLKSHAFFAGINWAAQTAALPVELAGRISSMVPSAEAREADDEAPPTPSHTRGLRFRERFMSTGSVSDAEFDPEPDEQVLARDDYGFPVFESNPIEEQAARSPSPEPEVEASWAKHLRDGETVILHGIVSKKRRRFQRSRKRHLFLTNMPRLFYLDPDTNELRGEISWSSKIWVEQKNEKRFRIHTPTRIYTLKAVSIPARRWLVAIQLLKINIRSAPRRVNPQELRAYLSDRADPGPGAAGVAASGSAAPKR